MNKKLLKAHKRKVERAKARKKISEPDLRTPEEIKAAREASRPKIGHGNEFQQVRSAPSARGHRSGATASAAKVDA